MSTESTNIRLDTKTKKEAYEIFKKVGLKPAQAFNLFLKQVALRGGLPFEIRIPNTDTINAIKELENGEGIKSDSSDDFYEDLEI
ncbi:MAG: type II toxin-antitoxin system RelB/DinJ family antitoxin [Candidatus Dadabacteria bacterium]|nr:type II toxin-antitoxin system RelB/DinJ family antitoxin [Candidatus Dadabacteria bacterium]NIS07847.1 type II toxin-antitoxin system RelB/DinJ family antitoxin [Candidatus Dadabacteria bacterium]NIV42819.1 type II toxin-antitoxin system RelB/DinJ family antitoxin [Candidatus Dadabacteria bacterium]NIY21635.1 type II toxin-antitoxin system RelB/DinJ family antitoxin [Candidatus Dadabacteria bacterium]